MNRNFKGIWIPKEIWLAQDLSCQERCLWAEIHSLYDPEKGGCYASNEYLMEYIGVKERRLQEMIAHLKSKGWIEQVSFDGRQRVIKAVVPQEDDDCAGQRCGKVHLSGAEKCTPEMQESAPPSICIDNSLEKREEKKKKSKRRSAALSIEFCYESNTFLNVTLEDVGEWTKLYPGVDIQREMRLMRQWLMDPKNPERDGNRTFITNWLSKSLQQVSKSPKKPTAAPKPESGQAILQYNGSIASDILSEEGPEEYVSYLRKVVEKKYYQNFIKGIYEPEYIKYMNRKQTEGQE